MDAVNVLILCVVGFCVVVCLILDHIEEGRKKCCNEADQSSVVYDAEIETSKGTDDDDDDQVDKEIVGADFESEKQVIITQNTENPVSVFEEIKEQVEEESGLCSGVLDIGEDSKDNMGISEGEDENFDDWEGIERTELEKIFGKCLVFMSYNSNADKINEDVKLELYGLQKVAFEGACHGSQPMAFNVSARSKWDAWQKLGNMNREMAMEKYVDILSKAIPGWKSGEGTEATKDATS